MPQGQSYPNFQFRHDLCNQLDVFVEVSAVVRPSFHQLLNGTFEMRAPGALIKLASRCSQDVGGFRPFEDFNIALPEVQQVIFDPWANLPPGGRVWCQARKVATVIELPTNINMNAKLKVDSPFGSLVAGGSSTILNYRLQIDGQLALRRNSGHVGASHVEVELDFTFDCYVGGHAVADPSQSQVLTKTAEGLVVRDGPSSVPIHAQMHKSASEGYFT
jgi:hypothetical protein